jgi:hypothetical protein
MDYSKRKLVRFAIFIVHEIMFWRIFYGLMG